MVMDVPDVDVVADGPVAEADTAAAAADAVAASSRCPGVAAVVAPGWPMMFDDGGS